VIYIVVGQNLGSYVEIARIEEVLDKS